VLQSKFGLAVKDRQAKVKVYDQPFKEEVEVKDE